MKVTPKQFVDRWNENETCMGEMAAFHVSCEELGVDPDDAWELVAERSNELELEEEKRNDG